MITRSDIFMAISTERQRQDRIHPDECDGDPFIYLAALVEEVGEVSKAILESNPDSMKHELVHVAAVAVRMLERGER